MMKTTTLFCLMLQAVFVSVVAVPVVKKNNVSEPAITTVDSFAPGGELVEAPPKVIKKRCECGVFNVKSPTQYDKPIISQIPTHISYDSVGEPDCQEVCLRSAGDAIDFAGRFLCASLGHYNHLDVSLYSRLLGAKMWKPTGSAVFSEMCCHNNQLINCKNQVENPSPKNHI